jgi:hypothetical protein
MVGNEIVAQVIPVSIPILAHRVERVRLQLIICCLLTPNYPNLWVLVTTCMELMVIYCLAFQCLYVNGDLVHLYDEREIKDNIK